MRNSPLRTYLATFIVAMLIMAAYEWCKELVFDGSLSLWQSHAITIVTTAIIAVIAAVFVRIKTENTVLIERLAIENDLREINDQLRMAAKVLEVSSDGIVVTDANSVIESVNPAFSEITSYSESEAIGGKPSMLRSDHHGPEFYQAMWESLIKTKRWEGEITNRRKSGEVYIVHMSISAITNQRGSPAHYVGVFHDITDARNTQERIRHLAFHDALTGLPNRLLLHDRIEHAINRSQRDKKRLGLAFIDLDGFKDVNDRLGHDTGDMLLKEIATRLSYRMRRNTDTVARFGGDEFVVLLEDVKRIEDCESVAEEIIADISEPITLRDHPIQVSASIGVAFYPEDSDNTGDLMQQADLAMYAAKAEGKGTYRRFSNSMKQNKRGLHFSRD